MIKNIVLTGMPKSGKSTLLHRLITEIPNKVGFITTEIKENAQRVGFTLETQNHTSAVLAHINFNTDMKVGKYFVEIKNLEALLPEVEQFTSNQILYIDEIGQMSLGSEKFKNLVRKYFDSPNICLATVSQVYVDAFIEEIKSRKDVKIFFLTEENRDQMYQMIQTFYKKVCKSFQYSSDQDRFKFEEVSVKLNSEHGNRFVTYKNEIWNCTCDYFLEQNVCSHVMAVGRILNI